MSSPIGNEPPRDWGMLAINAGRVFNPNTPIDEKSLFAGRITQLRRVIDAVNQRGQHAILFGERGVGKTSLANVLSQYLSGQAVVISPRVNCDSGDSFSSLMKKVFDQIELQRSGSVIGFHGENAITQFAAGDVLGIGRITPDSVRRVLTVMSNSNSLPILIFDEFDRLRPEPKRAFADLIKTLSDHDVYATIVLVGVADSVVELIEAHQSISRSVVEIQMPRMASDEIREIIDQGLARLGMTTSESEMDRIVLLSQGLPHYTHLVALHASRAALDAQSATITMEHVDQAIEKSIQDAQQSIRSAYQTAIRSSQKANLFADVLLACSMAKTDEFGYFAAQDVRPPLRLITGKPYDIPNYAQHLNEFSEEKRGRILAKAGQKRRFRYRFRDPLMQPYIVMHGIRQNKIGKDHLLQRPDES